MPHAFFRYGATNLGMAQAPLCPSQGRAPMPYYPRAIPPAGRKSAQRNGAQR